MRDKVEAKSKNMAKVFRQFDENKDGDISYGEFRLGLRHLVRFAFPPYFNVLRVAYGLLMNKLDTVLQCAKVA